MPSAAEQVARVEAIAEAVESPTFAVQFGPSGAAMVLGRIARAPSRRPRRAAGRRVHMHLLETRYQRAFADRAYPEGVVRASDGARPPVASA